MAVKYGDFQFDSSQGYTGSAGKKSVRGYMRGGPVAKPVRDIEYSEYAHATKTPLPKKPKDKIMAKGGSVQSVQLAKSKAVSKFAKSRPATKFKSGGKVQKVMHEFKTGELHSGSKKGPVVKSRKQAIAIALSEARKAKK